MFHQVTAKRSAGGAGRRIFVRAHHAAVRRRAIGARVTDEEHTTPYDASFSGAMLGLGGGIQHVLSPSLTLDGGMELGFGRFSHYDWDGESGTADMNGNTTVRLKFGVMWRPAARRSS